MELVVAKRACQTKGTSTACSRAVKQPSPASPASSWGLTGRVGLRVLMHHDVITCRFFRSLPRSWLRQNWGRVGRDSKSLFSSPLRWSSSPFTLSSSRLPRSPSVSSDYIQSPVSRLSFPALKDRDREQDQAGPAGFQALDGHRGLLSAPGMTVSPLGLSTSQTAANTSTASTSSVGLRYNSSSG